MRSRAKSLNLRGMTVIETLVAASLGLLVLGLALMLLTAMLRGSGRGSTRVQLQEEAVVASNRILADLAQCNAAGVAIYDGADAKVLSLQRLVDVTADTPPVQVYDTQLRLYCYRPQEQKLFRCAWPPAPPALTLVLSTTRPTRPDASQLQQLGLQFNGQESLLARDLAEYSVTSAAPLPSISPPLTVHMVMQRQAGYSTPERFELTRTVSLRNAE